MCTRRKQQDDEPIGGRAQLASGSLARLFWRVFDALDYARTRSCSVMR